MKKISLLATAILLSLSAFAQSGKALYKKYSDGEGVSAVYISPAMFRMIGRLPDMQIEKQNGEKADITPLVRSLKGFYLLTVEDGPRKTALFADVSQLLDGGQYELLLETKDDGEVLRLYTVGDDSTVTSLIMIATDAEETTFICLDGEMTRGDLESLF